jgi:hypothetical protein
VLCLLAGVAGAAEHRSAAIGPGVDVRRVSDAALADALAASSNKTQIVVCGSNAEASLGTIARKRGRFRCVA